MEKGPYGLICPITHACDVLEPRWTIPILSEMWAGSSKFNEIRRGVGSISPALLSKRLKQLEARGLVDRVKNPATGSVDYFRTEKAIALEPALNALAHWSLRHLEPQQALAEVDVSALMWAMQRLILVDRFPAGRTVLRFHFHDEGLDYDTYWVLVTPGKPTEICSAIPGYDVDLYVETWIRVLPAILSGRSTVACEIEAERLYLSGDARLARTMQDWLKVTAYADEVDDIRAVGRAPDALACGTLRRGVRAES